MSNDELYKLIVYGGCGVLALVVITTILSKIPNIIQVLLNALG